MRFVIDTSCGLTVMDLMPFCWTRFVICYDFWQVMEMVKVWIELTFLLQGILIFIYLDKLIFKLIERLLKYYFNSNEKLTLNLKI